MKKELISKINDGIEKARKAKLNQNPTGFFTAVEYASIEGIHLRTAQFRLRSLAEQGVVKLAKGFIRDSSDRVQPTRGYILAE